MSVIPNLKMLTSVCIGSPAIKIVEPLIAMLTLSCRNIKKPTKVKWLLGEECLTDFDIECNGRRPWMSWRMSNKLDDRESHGGIPHQQTQLSCWISMAI